MPTPERVIEYYFAVVSLLGGLAVLLGIKYTLKRWRSLPETTWKVPAFSMGLLALVLASIIELPVMLLREWVVLAFAAGLGEETVKLLPLKFFRRSSGWVKWKLVIGTGFFLGLIEGIFYTAGIFAMGQPAYMVAVRLVLIGLHTVWAVISVGFLLGETGLKRLRGLAFSMITHALYDLPPLAVTQGYSGNAVAYLVGISTGFLLVTPLMAKKAVELAEKLYPPEKPPMAAEERQGTEEGREDITSSP
jgi:hypothetical protein